MSDYVGSAVSGVASGSEASVLGHGSILSGYTGGDEQSLYSGGADSWWGAPSNAGAGADEHGEVLFAVKEAIPPRQLTAEEAGVEGMGDSDDLEQPGEEGAGVEDTGDSDDLEQQGEEDIREDEGDRLSGAELDIEGADAIDAEEVVSVYCGSKKRKRVYPDDVALV